MSGDSVNDAFDDSFIAAAMPAFVSEAQEQLAMLEQLLLQLEDAPDDRELLDALFRCAHTVKGSAGIFGLDRVVGFTHHVETLLDEVREGKVALTPTLSTLLLQCKDEIALLVEDASQPRRRHAARGPASRAARRAPSGSGRQRASGRRRAARRACRRRPPVAPDRAVRQRDLPQRHGPAGGAELPARARRDRRAALRPRRRALARRSGCGELPPRLRLRPRHRGERAQIESAFSFVREDCSLSIEPVAGETAPVDRPVAAAGSPSTPSTGSSAAASAGPAARATRPPRADTRKTAVSSACPPDRLDQVINLLGELVIAGAGASCWPATPGRVR